MNTKVFNTCVSFSRFMFIARSPVFAYLNTSLRGLTTIRAFEAEKMLTNEFDNHQVSPKKLRIVLSVTSNHIIQIKNF